MVTLMEDSVNGDLEVITLRPFDAPLWRSILQPAWYYGRQFCDACFFPV